MRDVISSAGGDRITDVDIGTVEGIALIGADSANGTWQFSMNNGALWNACGSLSDLNATVLVSDLATRVRFVPAANFSGSAFIVFRAWDGRSGQSNGATGINVSMNGGTTAFSVASETASLTITDVNEAPVLTEGATVPVTMDEDNSPTAFALTLHATDGDGDTLTWSVLTAPSHGVATANGTGNSKVIGYTPAADYNSPTLGADSFVVQVSDGNGGTASITVNVTVNRVNDAPVNTVPLGQTVDEDTNLTFSSGSGNPISTVDVDVAEDAVNGNRLRTTITVSHGKLTLSQTTGLTINPGANGSASMTITGLASSINAALNGMAFRGDADYSGADTLSVVTSDLGYTGSGGELTDTDSVPITVNNTNDLPVLAGAGNTLAYAENQAATPICTTITLTDPDDVTMETALVQISANYVNGQDVLAFADTATIVGTWTSSTGWLTLTRVAGQTPTLAEWRNALRSVTYFNSSENPSTSIRSVVFRVNDGDGDSGFVLSTISVAPLNDLPALVRNNPLSLNEGATATITDETHLKYNDPDNTPSQLTLLLQIVPVHGTLKRAGVDLGVLSTFTQDDLDTDKITYAHDGGESRSDSFTFDLNDGAGGILNGRVFSINIANVNDPPTVSGVTAPNVVDSDTGKTAYDFTITLSDDTAVDVSTLDNNDVYVTTPSAGTIAATFVSVDTAGNGTPRAATYRIVPQGGSWDVADNGTYTIGINGSQVGDEDATYVAANANIGTFTVTIVNEVPVITEGATVPVTIDEDNSPTAFALRFTRRTGTATR